MAITISYTPVTERPRLLTIESHDSSSSMPAPSTSARRSDSPASEPEGPSSTTVPPPAGLNLPHTRYVPVRTHSSPAVVLNSQGVPTRSMARRPVPPTPTPSVAFSPGLDGLPTIPSRNKPPAIGPTHSVIPTLVNANYFSISKTQTEPFMTPDFPHHNDHLQSRSDSGSTSDSQQPDIISRKRTGKRRCGTAAAPSHPHNARSDCANAEWYHEGWSRWFRKIWRE